MKYLVDSDWVVYDLRGVTAVTQKLDTLAPDGLALSIMTVAEIYEGFYNSRNPAEGEARFRQFLSRNVTVLTINEEICRVFARERARLRRQGTRIEDLDLFIGATALQHNLIVLTNNRRDFERVQGLEIISI